MGALIGPLVQVATSLIGGFAQMQAANAQASAQQAAAEAQARSYELNAQIAQNNAIAAQQAADYEAEDERRENRYEQSQRKVAYLKGGVTLSGSPIMVLEEEFAQGEVDALRIQHEGAVRANDYRNQAKQNKYQAQVARMNGQNQGRTTILGASTSLIK